MSKFVKLCLVLVLLAGCFDKDEKKAEKDYNLTIATATGEVNYKVENAVTPEQLQAGLMNRDNLAEDSGMIFHLANENVRGVAMWMKNTRIPLDMLFMNSQGKIIWIYENAIPYSEDLIAPPMPVAAVIEINGGQVRKHKIQNGDTVKHAFFDEMKKSAEPVQDGEINDIPAAPKNIETLIVDETPLEGEDEVELGDNASIKEISQEEAANAVAPRGIDNVPEAVASVPSATSK